MVNDAESLSGDIVGQYSLTKIMILQIILSAGFADLIFVGPIGTYSKFLYIGYFNALRYAAAAIISIIFIANTSLAFLAAKGQPSLIMNSESITIFGYSRMKMAVLDIAAVRPISLGSWMLYDKSGNKMLIPFIILKNPKSLRCHIKDRIRSAVGSCPQRRL